MVPSGNTSAQRRQRTKQTISAPRHVRKEATQEMEKLVLVTTGKMEHQAWLLEEIGEVHTVLVRWESTGTKERVPVLSVRQNLSSRRYKSCEDDFDSSDDEAEMRRTEIYMTRKKPRRSRRTANGGGPSYKSCDDSDSSDDEAEMRRTEKRLTRKKPRRSCRTANGGGPRYKSCDDSDSSDDEAEMRRTEKQLTRKKPRRSRRTANGGGPRSSVVTRVSACSGDYSSEDEYSIPILQTDADRSGRRVQSSKKSDSATETKWSVAFAGSAMDSLKQALQDDIGKTVCSFESKVENNLHLVVNASSVPTSEGCDC
jgi:hypothetical protein